VPYPPSGSTPISARVSRRREYLLLLSTLVVGFGLLEIGTRAIVPSPLQWNFPQVRYQVSSTLGFRMQPNQVGFTADKPLRTNALGLRGPNWSTERTPGVRRVLVLGDSIAFGHGVALEDTFPQKLEQSLNDASGRGSTEVINAAVPAYNTQQEVTYFLQEGVGFQPDVTVLALYWNDISAKTGVTADAEGRLVDDATPANPGRFSRWAETPQGFAARNILKRSSFLYFVVDRFRYLRAGTSRSTPKQAAMQESVLTGTPHPAVSAGWDDIEKHLRILADECRTRHIELVVAILPMPQLLSGQYPHAQYPSRVLSMCERIGVRCLDLHPAFARNFNGHGSLFIPYDGDHPNEHGHRIIAEELASVLRRSRTP
jgi:lysophospholipase L1-like esterase